jgi:Carboxypeptidase regulatory-like domain
MPHRSGLDEGGVGERLAALLARGPDASVRHVIRRHPAVILVSAAALAAGALAPLAAQEVRGADSSGTLTASLADRDDSQPVAYGRVTLSGTLSGTMHASFAGADGRVQLARLVPGTYTLQARQIGYAPVDTTIVIDPAPATATVALRMHRNAARLGIVRVEGHRDRGCVAPGVPDSTVDSTLAAIFAQVRENVNRYTLLLDEYPFRYTLEQQRLRRLIPGGDSTEAFDSTSYESRDRLPYRVGSIVYTASERGKGRHQFVYLPTFANLADSTFLGTHCFAYGGITEGHGGTEPRLIRVDFRPADTIKVPDVAGTIYLDAQRLVVRRAVFEVTKPWAARPPLIAFKVTTTFRELVPLVPVLDSVESEQQLPPMPTSRGYLVHQTVTNDHWVDFKFAQRSLGTAASASVVAAASGTLSDSIHGGALAGATIVVDGTGAAGVTDGQGRFHIDGIPPGSHRLAVHHPYLDSLGLNLSTAPMQFSPGIETALELGTPSRTTLLSRFCGSDSTARSIVVGQVLDVDSDAPVPGTIVVASVDTIKRAATTNDAGRFLLCLPNGARPVVKANIGNSSTGQIPVDVTTGIGFPMLYIAHDVAPHGGRALLNGHVQTADGHPVDHATITVDASTASATSGADGTFHLTGAPSGTQMVTVRRVGFAEWTMPVPLASTSPRTITVVLQPGVPLLGKVEVTATAAQRLAAAYARIGFSARQQGMVGHFLTADEIARRNVQRTTDLLRTVPGVSFRLGPTGTRVISSRELVIVFRNAPPGFLAQRSCAQFIIDGQNVNRGLNNDDETLPPPSEIIGIEVYQPEETYPGSVRNNCLTIVIWTKAMLEGSTG